MRKLFNLITIASGVNCTYRLLNERYTHSLPLIHCKRISSLAYGEMATPFPFRYNCNFEVFGMQFWLKSFMCFIKLNVMLKYSFYVVRVYLKDFIYAHILFKVNRDVVAAVLVLLLLMLMLFLFCSSSLCKYHTL